MLGYEANVGLIYYGPKWSWAEMVMGRNGHGPKWLWAEMTRNLSNEPRHEQTNICENKDAGQLRGNREADQRLCFRYVDSTFLYFLSSKFQASSHLW